MALGFKSVEREQGFLVPPDVRDWLPRGHLALFVVDVVAELDLSQVERGYRLGGAGRRAYDPEMLTALVFYGLATGRRSSRALERACETDVACRVIMVNQRPDHATIARFLSRHAAALAGLFGQVLGLCAHAGVVDGGLVALDSTKIVADASGRVNVTRARLEAQAQRLLDEAVAADAAEDARFGGRRGDELAPGWEPGPGRDARIREALAELDRQERPEREVAQRQAARAAAGQRPEGRKRLPADPSKPRRKNSRKPRRVNLTDPDSRVMKTPRGYVQGYNAQAAASSGGVIVAAAVTNDRNDTQMLAPMTRQVIDNLARAGQPLGTVLADRGYWNGGHIQALQEHGTDVLVATGHDRAAAAGTPRKEPWPGMEAMHARLVSEHGRATYRRRAALIEPVFGHIKHNRGYGRFLRRGLDAVQAEWRLICTAHNLTKLWKAAPAPA